jgi:TOMM system kinase/cyclase fusion protein
MDSKVNFIECDIKIDQYEITNKISTGNDSTVYLAIQKSTEQNVAIKVMHTSQFETDEEKEKKIVRFRREMKLCAQIHHQNVVRVIDFGNIENKSFYTVFEYIPGETLSSLLKKEGALPLDRCRNILLQILEGIQSAHSLGIIHRDLKPENIMIIPVLSGDTVKILDFGISTFVPSSPIQATKITLTREFLGTPAYCAPEQLKGEHVTYKADLFSWGLIAVECITGQLVYQENNMAKLVQKMLSSNPIPLPSAIANHPLGSLLGWVLQKDPHRRASDALQVIKRFSSINFAEIPKIRGYFDDNVNNLNKSTPSTSPASPFIYDERKQLTILSVMLQLDISEGELETDLFDEIYFNIFESCRSIASSAGGFCNCDANDRLIIYFGYPSAMGNEVRKAAATALQIAITITQRNILLQSQHRMFVSYRAGIHTGMVTIRKNNSDGEQLTGIATSIAGKLCSLAPDNSILISEKSHSILHSTFDCKPFQTIGNTERNYLLSSAKLAEGIINTNSRVLDYFSGREDDCTLIQKLWDNAINNKKGTGVLISGEAGVGKSRIVSEILKRNTERNWIEMRCLEEYSNSALAPVTDFINSLTSASSMTHNQIEVAIEKLLESSTVDKDQFISLYMYWMGFKSQKYPPLKMAPAKQKKLFIELLVKFISDYVKVTKASIIIEDLHWVDTTTSEFISELLTYVIDEGIFVILTARPSFSDPWSNTLSKKILLKNLSDEEISLLIRNQSSVTINESIITQIIQKADGIPLYAVELLSSFNTSDGYKQGTSPDGIASLEIPMTLRDLLASRLDQMGMAKETIQLASVIGRWFDYDLLVRLSSRDEGTLLADLDQLVSAGIIDLIPRSNALTYVFHHTLIKDAAYDSITKAKRREIHWILAELLEKDTGSSKFPPEQIAYHWARASNFERACEFKHKSISIAFTKSLYQEAINHAHEAINWARLIDDEKSRVTWELKVIQLLVPSLISSKGFAYPEIEELNNRSEVLLPNLEENTDFLFSMLWGKIVFYHTRPDYKKCVEILSQAFDIATKTENNDHLSALYAIRCHQSWSHGVYDKAIVHADEAINIYDKGTSYSHCMVYGHDTKVLALGIKALTNTICGKLDQAHENMELSKEYAQKLGNANSMALAYVYEFIGYHQRHDYTMVSNLCNDFEKFTTKYELDHWNSVLKIFKGWLSNDRELARVNLDFMHTLGIFQLDLYWHFIIAQIEYELKDYHACLKTLEPFIEIMHTIEEKYYIPELLRLKALCMYELLYPEKEIETTFRLSIESSQNMSAHLFTLRALCDYHSRIQSNKLRDECLQNIIDTKKHITNEMSLFDNKRAIFITAVM